MLENNIKEKYKTLIRKVCPMCNEIYYMKVTEDEHKQIKSYWTYGGLIQEKLSLLDKFGRKFVKSGYCPECQEIMFSKNLEEKSKYFSQKSLRSEVMAKFSEKAYENKLSCFDAIQSKIASVLNYNEKILFLYEMGLDNCLYLDENGNVKES